MVCDRVGGPILARMAATLGTDVAAVAAMRSLPFGWHLAFCIDSVQRDALSTDGLPRGSAGSPDIEGFPTRVMGATSMEFLADIPIGCELACETRVVGLEDKQGRSGPLKVLKIGRSYRADNVLAVDETQDIVYLPAPPATGATTGADRQAITPRAGDSSRSLDEIDVFRFSAITFNSHRLHYDRGYACGVEGWTGVLVQAKFLALLALQASLQQAGRPPVKYSFRSVAALTCPRTVAFRVRPSADGGFTNVSVDDGQTTFLTGRVDH